MSHGHGAEHVENKKIAIFISVLALFLAIAETAGKGAQTDSLRSTIEASNLWSFFQAKTIRKTMLETAAETLAVDVGFVKNPAVQAELEKRIKAWRAKIAGYDSEPKPNGLGEGRKELMQRALAEEKARDTSLAKYHNYEIASGAFQIAIVLATVFIVTGVVYTLWIAFGLGALGLIFMLIAMFAPNAVHLL